MADHPENATLVLGASGLLGQEIAALPWPGPLLATHHRNPTPGSVHFDACTMTVAQLLASSGPQPSTAIVALGLTAIDDCARDPAGTAATNVDAVCDVIRQLRTLGILPVFVSSDGVFDGSRAMWGEGDAPCPILEYGRQKAAVEQYLAAQPGPWMVVRLPKLMAAHAHPKCMVTGWIGALGRPGRILCATDQFFTPADARDVAAALAELAAARAQGVFHLASPTRISRRALLAEVADEYRRFARPRAEIVDCLLADLPVLEQRPRDTSLGSRRFAQQFTHRFRDAATVARTAVRAHFSGTNPGSTAP